MVSQILTPVHSVHEFMNNLWTSDLSENPTKVRRKSDVRPTLEKAEVNPEPTSQDVWPREPSPQFI
jgi:hypothetical protein